jgi:hypothetical protein
MHPMSIKDLRREEGGQGGGEGQGEAMDKVTSLMLGKLWNQEIGDFGEHSKQRKDNQLLD